MTRSDANQTEPLRLSRDSAGALLEHAVAAASANMPLEEMFLALAEDADDRRLRRASQEIAAELSRGADLPTAMRTVGGQLPASIRQALDAAADAGQTVAVLQGLARHETTRKRLRRQMRSVFLYPAIVIFLLVAIVCGLLFFVLPQFRELYEDFDLELPTYTLYLLSAADVIPWVLAGLVVAPILYLTVSLSPGGRRLLHWLRTGVPFLGRIWIWNAHHEFVSVLGALVSQRVVLQDALRCTVASLRDQNVARAARIAARKCDEGALLSQSLSESLHFDRALSALVAWGEANDALPEALRQATDLYEKEIELHAIFLRRVLPPILFIAVVVTMFFFVMAIMLPLVDLISNLSG